LRASKKLSVAHPVKDDGEFDLGRPQEPDVIFMQVPNMPVIAEDSESLKGLCPIILSKRLQPCKIGGRDTPHNSHRDTRNNFALFIPSDSLIGDMRGGNNKRLNLQIVKLEVFRVRVSIPSMIVIVVIVTRRIGVIELSYRELTRQLVEDSRDKEMEKACVFRGSEEILLFVSLIVDGAKLYDDRVRSVVGFFEGAAREAIESVAGSNIALKAISNAHNSIPQLEDFFFLLICGNAGVEGAQERLFERP